jgi:hypothetical protein
MLLNLRNFILPIFLTLQTAYCWKCFYDAQFLEYDDNYGSLIRAFVISLLALLILIFVWLKRRHWIENSKLVAIVWLFLGSPATLAVAAIYYQEIFGTTLAN